MQLGTRESERKSHQRMMAPIDLVALSCREVRSPIYRPSSPDSAFAECNGGVRRVECSAPRPVPPANQYGSNKAGTLFIGGVRSGCKNCILSPDQL